jgi:hypothetical protein
MSNILRRPMFRGGGKVSSYGNGIASGLGYARVVDEPEVVIDGISNARWLEWFSTPRSGSRSTTWLVILLHQAGNATRSNLSSCKQVEVY